MCADWDLGVCLLYECKRKQLRVPESLKSWIDLRATYRVHTHPHTHTHTHTHTHNRQSLMMGKIILVLVMASLNCLSVSSSIQKAQRFERSSAGPRHPVHRKRALGYTEHTHTLSHALTHTHSHALTHSLTHTLTHTHCHTLSLTYSLIHSLTHTHTLSTHTHTL